MPGKVDGIALSALGAGGLFVYAGITGKSIPGAVQAIVQGKSPATARVTNPIRGTGTAPGSPVTGPVTGTATGQQIATDALIYQGHLYKYGGAPGLNGQDPWDCSSFANWVIGHDFGLAIPGDPPGGYDGSVHGANTIMWLAWSGVTHIKRAEAGAGDIFCWQTHMGIATGNDSMISAQGPDGTPSTLVANGGIDSFIPGEILFVLRLKATLPAGNPVGK